MQAFICVGILVAYLVGLPYQHNTPQAIALGGRSVSWWRVMFLFGIIPAVLQVPSPPSCGNYANAASGIAQIAQGSDLGTWQGPRSTC